MRRAYVDTSVLLAIAFAEPGAVRWVRVLNACEELLASNLLEAELRAAHAREETPPDEQVLAGISWILPDRTLGPEIARVLAQGYLGGADCWHLATALYVSPRPADLAFYSLDAKQAAVAKALGFPGVHRR
jgi:predicted nucleic acid-binding protein